MVRYDRLQCFHRDRRNRLSAGCDGIQGIRGTGMVCRPLADHRLGRLPVPVPRHAMEAQGTPHLCGELVLSRLHRHHRDAASRQQRDRSGLGVRHQVVHRLVRCAGCHGAVVVRPQRGGLLPDRRLPRHDVLLRAGAGAAPDLLLPAVDRAFLGADRRVHVGRPPPSALLQPARLGAIRGHGVLHRAAGAQLGRHDQRCHDPLRRLAQAAHRPDHPLPDRRPVVLRHEHLRRPDDVDQDRQRAQPQHRLDHRPCALRRARLGGDDHLRRRLRDDAATVRPPPDVLGGLD